MLTALFLVLLSSSARQLMSLRKVPWTVAMHVGKYGSYGWIKSDQIHSQLHANDYQEIVPLSS